MNKYILGFENWRKIYSSSSHDDRKKVWISITTSDKQEIYLREFEDWYSFQEHIDTHKLSIIKIGLRYKSNFFSVDTMKCDGVYLVRSVKGQFGSKTKQCFTIGIVKDGKVQKTMVLTPELIEEQSYEDNVENCFEEAIVYHGQEKTGTI